MCKTWAAQATCPAPPHHVLCPGTGQKRNADWGAQGLNDRLVQAWHQFSTAVQAPPQPWLVVQHHQGSAATQAVYQQVLGGQGSPRIGTWPVCWRNHPTERLFQAGSDDNRCMHAHHDTATNTAANAQHPFAA